MAAQTYILKEDRDRRYALVAVQRAPWGMQVKVSKPTRTTEQNSHLHSLISDVAKQVPAPDRNGLEDIEFWKPRLTLSWIIDKKREFEIITALNGQEFGILLPHTSDLTTEQCAELIEWIYMFGATNGVKFKEPKRAPEPPPAEDYRR